MDNLHASSDPYIDQASGVLKNNLGITDARELAAAEADAASVKSYDIQQSPPQGNYDLKHLQDLHHRLFSEVYPWAGKLRTVNISKGGNLFAHHQHIEKAAASLFKNLAGEKHLAGLDRSTFSGRAAHYLSEINALHPFRDGNGRTQREFIGQLAQKNGYYIAWEQMTDTAMREASREAFLTDPAKLTALLEQHLHPVEQTVEIQESFYARAAEMIKSREAAQDRDTERGFDMER